MQSIWGSKGGILVRLVTIALVGSVGGARTTEARTASELASGRVGVVMEDVGEGSALEKAGRRPGDVAYAWERLPNPPANPQGARGTIESVFDWMGLEVEQAPRGTVKLTGQRDGEIKVFEVVSGKWKIAVRARMPKLMLEDYERGRKLIDAGDFEAGTDLWYKVAGVAESQALDNERLTCWLLLHIGDAWGEARQWEKAHDAYRAALKTARDPLARVAIWQAIGFAYEKANDFEPARKAYGSAREIRQGTWGESLALARSLNVLGRLDAKQRRLAAAQGYFEAALEIQQKLAPTSLDVASSLSGLGILDWIRGGLERAVRYHEGALEIRQKLAPDSLDEAASLNNLGILVYERGDFDRTAEYYEDALEIWQRLAPGSLEVAAALTNLGNLAATRGDLDRAAEYHRSSLGIEQKLAPGSFEVAQSLNNLGLLAVDRGDLDRATERYEDSLELLQKLVPRSLAVASSLNNLGTISSERGDWDQATRYFERSLEIRRNLAPGTLDVADSLNNLGLIAVGRGDLDRASENYERSLEIQQELAPGTLDVAETLTHLAAVRRKQDQPQAALDPFLQALQALESQINRLGASRDVQAGFRAERAAYYRDTIDLLLELQQPEEAFHVLERSRAQSFLAQLAERDLVFSDVPEELERQRRRVARRYDQTQGEIAELNPREQVEELETLRTRLQQLHWDYEDITEKIVKASPKLGALRYPEPLELDAARRALDPGTVMLSYSVGETSTELFVVARKGTEGPAIRVASLALGEQALRRQVQRWHEAIQAARAGDESGALHSVRFLGKRLYQQLIAPVADIVAGSERLLIIPDGALHVVPWGALIREIETTDETGRSWQYLAEWKALHTVLSATVYAELKQSRRPNSRSAEAPASIRLAAFGDPIYPGTGDGFGDFRVRSAIDRGLFDGWKSLPYTRQEVERIAALYPQETTRTFLGAEATEEAVKAVGRRPQPGPPGGHEGEIDILHLATHGHLDDRFPLDSAVVLTLPEDSDDGRDNGLLQVREIFERVRLEADLVVLSACASGVGKESGGEGLIGLTRAFQFAGARSVVASLWNVRDRATAELMVRFHRHLNAGLTKDEALRAAQLDLIRGIRTDRDYSAPFYWAPFQIYGDWQ